MVLLDPKIIPINITLILIVLLIISGLIYLFHLSKKIHFFKKEEQSILDNIKERTTEINHLNIDLIHLDNKIECFINEINEQQKEIEHQNNTITSQKETINSNFTTIEQLRNQYQSLSKQIDEGLITKKTLAEQDFLNFQRQQQEDIDKFIDLCNEKRAVVQASLDELESKEAAAVAARARAMKEEQDKLFYQLLLDDSDLMDDKELKEFTEQHANKPLLVAAIGKVRWAVIWSKAYTDLIGRLFNGEKPCGIYKITNIINGMCYVGQAANIPERWSQHIKRALGAEPRTNNKLYPIMSSVGLENFSFEMIEECDRSVLNSREDYWQEYFKAKEFGYSMR